MKRIDGWFGAARFSRWLIWGVVLTGVGASSSALAGVDCTALATAASTARKAEGEPTYRVKGAGRLAFYAAPDDACLQKDLFIVAGDRLKLLATQPGWSKIRYTNPKSKKSLEAWVRSEGIEPDRSVDCSALAARADSEGPVFRPAMGFKVVGKEPLLLFTAPDPDCRATGAPIPTKALISGYQEFSGWIYVMVLIPGDDSEGRQGWIPSQRLLESGTLGPSDH